MQANALTMQANALTLSCIANLIRREFDRPLPAGLPLLKQGCFIPFQTGFVKMVSEKVVSEGDEKMDF